MSTAYRPPGRTTVGIERIYGRWRDWYEQHRNQLRRTLPGEMVVRSIDLKLPSRATVLSTLQVACVAPLAVGIMAMVHPSTRGNLGRLLGSLLGLDDEADTSLASLFGSTQSIATATGVLGILFLVGWCAGVPGYMQRLLEDIWSLPARGFATSLLGQLNWFVGFGVAVLVLGWPVALFRRGWLFRAGVPEAVLVVVVAVWFATELWNNYVLLGRRIPAARLVPGAALSTLATSAVLVGLHLWASPVLNSTVDQFGLIAFTFLAQATAVLVAGAMVFGELLGAELDRRRHPELWPEDVVVHDAKVAENPASWRPPPHGVEESED